ncbi:MAG: hypothetical protein ABW174_08440, partial [Flavitalea sp.]
ITTDHGRGEAQNGKWRDHGSDVKGAGEIWLAVIGAGVYPLGESAENKKIFQGQIAATIAQLVGVEFKPAHPVLPALNLSVK